MLGFNNFCVLYEKQQNSEQVLLNYLSSLSEKNKKTQSSTTHLKRVNWQAFPSVEKTVADMKDKISDDFSIKKSNKEIAGSGARNLIAYEIQCTNKNGYSYFGSTV